MNTRMHREFQDIVSDGRLKMGSDEKGAFLGYSGGDATNRERVAVMTTDMLREVVSDGFIRWIKDHCLPHAGMNLPERIATIATTSRRIDPAMSDIVVHAMRSSRSLVQAVANAQREDLTTMMVDRAWYKVAWCEHVFVALEARLSAFMAAACLEWPENVDPLAIPISADGVSKRVVRMRPSKGFIRYPTVSVGMTAAGASCAFVSPEVGRGDIPRASRLAGIAAWALWSSGVGLEEIRAFALDFERAPTPRTVGAWINVDGEGMAGMERLRECIRPAHPWASMLNVDEDTAQRTRIVFCAHEEHGAALLFAVGSRSPIRLHHVPGDEKVDQNKVLSARNVGEMTKRFTQIEGTRIGTVIVTMGSDGQDLEMAQAVADGLRSVDHMVVVGATPRFRSMIESALYHEGSDADRPLSIDALGTYFRSSTHVVH